MLGLMKKLQPLFEELHQARRHEAGIAARLINRIAEPVMGRTLHDTSAREEIRLFQTQQECVGLGTAIDQVVLGPDGKEYAHAVVGEGRMVDG